MTKSLKRFTPSPESKLTNSTNQKL